MLPPGHWPSRISRTPPLPPISPISFAISPFFSLKNGDIAKEIGEIGGRGGVRDILEGQWPGGSICQTKLVRPGKRQIFRRIDRNACALEIRARNLERKRRRVFMHLRNFEGANGG